MSSVEITVTTERSSYLPGEQCNGEVSWRSDIELEGIEVRLFWYTTGKGDRDSRIIESLDFSQVGRSGTRPFRFLLPKEPYSFSGKIISLVWALEGVALPGKKAARVEFVLSPTGREILLSSPAG